MIVFKTFTAVFVAFSVVASLVGATAGDDAHKNPVVHIKNGPIMGETIKGAGTDQRSVHRFLGIPYAEPPVGKLRFRRTRPLEAQWTQPLEATKWPKKCIQDVNHPWNTVGDDDNFEFNHEVSEDCLFLNVWTPTVDAPEDKLRPVVMWIHGGALFMGTSSMFLYDAASLAKFGDAVIVTINYRLSTLGFMYSDKIDDIKGNQGMWDQAMALEWIKDNIRYFGGDPNMVTIIGESAGGWSVSGHVLSPVSRDLFHNAMMMSGAIDNRMVATPEQMVAQLLKGIRKVGCATESEVSITEQVMDCINALEPAMIDQIFHVSYDTKFIFPPLLTADGEFFPDLPMEMLKNGDFKQNVNLIAASVENEGSFMLGEFDQFRAQNPAPISLEEAKKFAAKLLNEEVLVTKKVCEKKLGQVYFNGLHPMDDEDIFRNQASIAYGDLILNCPVMNFAKEVKRNSPEKTSVFQIFYRVHLGTPKFLCSKWSRACHTDDIFSVFGLPFTYPDHFVNREREVSLEIMNFFSDFIRTGAPNTRMPQWQSYFMLDNQTVVAPYFEITNKAPTNENFKLNLKQTECAFLKPHMEAY